jgi:hypothetical protein
VIKAMARIENEGTFGVLVKATGTMERSNLEGALTAECSLRALVAAMTGLATDRGYGWEDQRKDLVSRWTGTQDKREQIKKAASLSDLLAAVDPSEARRLAAEALGADKPTPFEMKGGRQGRIFAEALVNIDGVPQNFANAFRGILNALSGASSAKATVTLECEPAASAAPSRP